jgi:hypothetical protein
MPSVKRQMKNIISTSRILSGTSSYVKLYWGIIMVRNFNNYFRNWFSLSIWANVLYASPELPERYSFKASSFLSHADSHDLSVVQNSLQENAHGIEDFLPCNLHCSGQHIFETNGWPKHH